MPLKTNIKSSFSETFQTIFSPLTVFIWLTSVMVTAVSGPFCTFAVMEFPQRAVYWLLVVSVATVLGYCARALTRALVDQSRPILFDAVMIALMTIACTPVIWMITRLVRSDEVLHVQPLLAFAGYVMLCTTVIVAGRRVAPGFEAKRYDFLPDAEPEWPDKAVSTKQPRILRRLSPEVQGGILRLTANDHFVEVATENGAESLRLRLSDAIDEMEPVKGYCVHRSHWVAQDAIVSVERENAHKLFVVLRNNDRIPVSRKYRSNLEKAGLI